jgi:hypothetical protein
MIVSKLTALAGAVAGGLIAFGVFSAYNALIDNPSIRKAERTVVEAEARQRTIDAINEITDIAERARAMRRYCLDSGMQYSVATGKCRQ